VLRAARRELLDDPVDSVDELEDNFRDIERANRYLGGLRVVRDAVAELSPQTILDVGCGSGDVGQALATAARGARKALRITCLDTSTDVLRIARRRHPDAALTFVQGNGAELPFEDGEFDVAMCNLTLHHCDPSSAVTLLRELRRVARLSPLVTDLRRSRAAWLGAKVLTALFTRNRLTRHDAPLSVLRAYSPQEALQLARDAGWKNPRVRKTPFFRMVLTDG
jgi:ubiquinone/menaquinone biosynthesis C-methylase UbiE